jgi:sulfur carrier protein
MRGLLQRDAAWRSGATIRDDQRIRPPWRPAPARGMADSSTPAHGKGPLEATISLTVNGESRRCPAGLKLPGVLEALGYRPQLVVVEFNGEILPRQRWESQSVGESDELEVVTIVGGGS